MPDFIFDAPSDPKRYLAKLQEAFPEEAKPLRPPCARCQMPIGGLYLTGSDVMSCGIVGTMMGGLKCLAVILGGKVLAAHAGARLF